MYLDSAKKQEIFAKHGKSNTDTGSPEAQIALFSYRISHLTEHLKLNKKDYNTERSIKYYNFIIVPISGIYSYVWYYSVFITFIPKIF